MSIRECFTYDGFFPDASWLSRCRMLLANPRYSALVLFRLQQAFRGRRRLSRLMARLNCVLNGGIEISNLATIGRGVDFHHTQGVVIGGDSVVGEGVHIFGRVTIGEKNGRYPRIGRGVRLYAGCVVIGGVTVGDWAAVGPNSLVGADVRPGDIVVGVPARSTRVLAGDPFAWAKLI